ncbi:MAG: ABC transporter substrate-binding protein [Thermodesulfovibrio sp.]|nr:ABC transporter substrate-binding protein [Thermodesulfovibrio sp.]
MMNRTMNKRGGVAMKVARNMFCGVVIMVLSAQGAFAETRIKIAGAGGMISLVTELAKAYMAENKDVVIEVNQKSIESKGGIMSASEGKVDIGMSARHLKDDEKGLGVQPVEISRAATVVGVNRSVALKDISSDHLCRIYGGKMTNWNDLGAGNNLILPLSRPDKDATKETVRMYLPCFKNLKEAASVVTIATAPEMTKVLSSRPHSVGFTDSVAVDDSAGAIVPLKLDGVEPSPENVKDGKYKIIKHNFLVTKGQASGPIKDFIGFVKGPKGAKIIQAHKAVPVK